MITYKLPPKDVQWLEYLARLAMGDKDVIEVILKKS